MYGLVLDFDRSFVLYMRLFAIADGFWLEICFNLDGWRMKDGSPGLVTTSSQSIYLMVGANFLVPVECPSMPCWLRT